MYVYNLWKLGEYCNIKLLRIGKQYSHQKPIYVCVYVYICMYVCIYVSSTIVFQLLDGRHGVKKADVDFFAQLKAAFEKLDESKESSGGKASSPKALKAKRSWKLQVVLTKCDLVERKVSPSLIVLCMYVCIVCMYKYMYVCMYV